MVDISDLLQDGKGNNFIDLKNFPDWINFFFIFSRFEYALKRSGYAKMNRYNNLEVEWGRFGQKVKEAFAAHDSDELKEAIDYFKNNSPKKQYLDDKQLKWCCIKEDYKNFQTLMNAVKRVRNNLFHGGKFPDPTGPVEDPTRNPDLINHSITILKYLLYSSPEVKEYYRGELEVENWNKESHLGPKAL